MEDLDSLLEDLGRGKSSSTVKKQRPPSSRVDLNELENLMEDLAAPTPKAVPEVRPVSSSFTSSNTANSVYTPPKTVTTTTTSSSSYSRPTSVVVPPQTTSYNAPSKSSYNAPPPTISDSFLMDPSPAPSNNSAANIDDLDALMESLNATSSSRSQRRSVAPTSTSSSKPVDNHVNNSYSAPPPSTSSYNAPPPSSSNSSYNASSSSSYTAPPPAKNTYNAPPSTSSYNAPPPSSNPYRASTTPSQPQPTAAPKQTQSTVYSAPPVERKPDPAPAPVKKGDDLDSLLQNLTAQMNNIDNDNPSSRGTCWTCKGHILGEVIQALGKTFHPEHFTCGNCRQPLGTRNFFEVNGSPQCENCYQELSCPKCAHCDRPVLDRCITALGKKWHVDHFICTTCLQPFAGGNFFERDGRPYCEADFYSAFAPKCGGCNEAIRGDCINALGSQWHPEHFVCSYCQKSFAGGSFFEHGGKPYCEVHYHQQTGSLCSGCGKAITGRCVNALDKKWHPEHFVCAFCMNPLAGGSFTEHNNKAYCKECHGKLFGAS